MRHYGQGRSASGERRENVTASARTIVRVTRRIGVILGAALDAAISELLRQHALNTATELRDALKPLVDSLCHFELDDLEEDDDATV